jgi:hypothetical protein
MDYSSTPPPLVVVNSQAKAVTVNTGYIDACGFSPLLPIGHKFVRINSDTTQYATDDKDLYALILWQVNATSSSKQTANVCRISHSTFLVEWTLTLIAPWPLNGNENFFPVHGHGNVFAYIMLQNGTSPSQSLVYLINASTGKNMFKLVRSAEDSVNYPVFLDTPTACGPMLLLQGNGHMHGYCLSTMPKSSSVLWPAAFRFQQTCVYSVMYFSLQSVFVCRSDSTGYGSAMTLQLRSIFDGSLVWSMPGLPFQAVGLGTDLVWAFSSIGAQQGPSDVTGKLLALTLTAASGSNQGAGVDGCSSGISGGGATGLCFLFLAIGAAAGLFGPRLLASKRRSASGEASDQKYGYGALNPES